MRLTHAGHTRWMHLGLLLFVVVLVTGGCSIKKLALKKVAGALTADGGTVFTGDDDPELVGDALPFALKTYESLLASLPEDDKLHVATAKAFTTYAYAFVQLPADTLPDAQIDTKLAQHRRAKKLFLRARDYALMALEIRHPGFTALLDSNAVADALALTTPADTTCLYWAALPWMGALVVDKFDMSLAVNSKKPVAFMRAVMDYNEEFGAGSGHEFFMSYYGGLPESMGGSVEKALEHYHRALELSGGRRVSTRVSLATAVSIPRQDIATFRRLLHEALAVDVDAYPSERLANILYQRKARWLLDNSDSFFLIDDGDDGLEGMSLEEDGEE